MHGLTAPQTEATLRLTGLGQAWVPLEQVLPHIRPQRGPLYRVGMLVGRVDLALAVVCSN